MATAGKIGDVFGWSQNPIYQNLASNKHALMNFGAGLASGNSWSEGLANGVGALPTGAARDDAFALLQEDKAKQAEALNQTTEWLRQNGKDALYAAVQSGAMAPGEAWKVALEEDAAARQGVKPIEINGQLVNPSTGEVMGDYRDPNAGQPEAPSGYQWTPEGSLAAIPGGPASRPAAVGWNSTTQKELFEAEDAVNAGGYVLTALDRAIALSPQAREKGGAGILADIGTWVPDIGVGGGDETDNATIAYKNTVNELALNQLKTIFGAAPTEGERKILLDIQGSVDQPRAVREKILRDARVAAERRIAEAQGKAAGLRSGEYFSPGYGGQQPPAGPRTTSSGVSFTVDQQ